MRLELLFLFFVVLIGQSFDGHGQAPVVKGGYCDTGGGDFDVSPAIGCGRLRVTITNNLVGAESIGYITNYDTSTKPTTFPTVTTETYTQPGNYIILQVGSKGSTGFTLCKQVTVHEDRKVNAQFEISCGRYAKVTMVDDEIAKAYDYVEIDWGDGQAKAIWKSGQAAVLNHAYFGVIPKITIQGRYNPPVTCSGEANYLDPVTTDNSVESIQIRRLEMKEDGKVALLYQGLDKVSTEIFYAGKNGTYTSTGLTNALKEPGNLNIDKSLDPEKEYKFKLVSPSDCGGIKDSKEAGTMVLKATSREGEIALEWNRYMNEKEFAGYQLLRDDVVIKSFSSIDDLEYTDKDLDCDKVYRYQIVALTDLVRSFSAPKSEKMITFTPEKITQASVTVSENNVVSADVVLSGKGLTSTYNLIVERAEQGSQGFKQVSGAQNQDTHFEDRQVNTAATSYCYRFSYENSCPLKSEFSDPVCTILLRQSPAGLTWNDANPFTEGVVSYDLMQTDPNTGTAGMPMGLNTSYDLDIQNLISSDYSFQIRAHSRNGSLLSFSNLVQYERGAVLLIPDAFTPNGDNVNERFEVKAIFVNTFKMSIFNRWGQVVFQSDDIKESWDGKIDGKEAPAGYYTYKTEYTDISDQPLVKAGGVLLIR